MLVIPAVDLLGGRCVRLVRGDPERSKVYYDDPVVAARLLEEQGASLVHVVDLDAALGSGDNTASIRRILENVDVKVEVGGGIRSLETADSLLKLGAYRVIFGTVAVKNPKLVREAVGRFGSESVVVAVDERDGMVAVHGWKQKSAVAYLDFAKSFEKIGVGALIFTPVSVDGTLGGPQVEKTKRLVEAVDVPVVASGGVATLDDLVALAKTGAAGAIVGTAIYEKRFTVKEALEAVKSVG